MDDLPSSERKGQPWETGPQRIDTGDTGRRDTARRALLAAGLVALLGGVISLVFWSTRDSPYRGRLAARSPGVQVTRGGESLSPRTLEVVELRAGDVVATGPDATAQIGASGGAEAIILGGSRVVVGDQADEIEILEGRALVNAEKSFSLTVIVNGRRYRLRGKEIEVSSPDQKLRLQARGGPAEVTDPDGKSHSIEIGGSLDLP